MAATDFATLADLTLYYPALVAAVDPTIVAQKLDFSECKFNAAKWGCNLFEGHLAYVAHCLKMVNGGTGSTTPGSTAGTITSMSQGPVSVSFGQSANVDSSNSSAWLSQTPEGQKFMELRRSVGVGCGVRVRGGGNCRRARIAGFA